LALQLLGLMIFNLVEFQHWSLTSDYAFYSNAFYQIAHGQLSSHFFRSHGEVAFILLAPTYWLWPHGPILQWDQDIAVVAAELVSFLWICDVISSARDCSNRLRQLLAGAGLVTLLGNPWIWWTLAFDFHFETVGALFAVLFARDLHNGRRRAWLWAALTVLSGDVSATYLLAVGLGALVLSRRRLWGLAAVASALFWFVVLHALGAMNGSANLAPLTQLAGQRPKGTQASSVSVLVNLSLGLLRHPGHVLSVIWSERLNTWANLAASGLLGILTPVTLFVPVLVIIENSLYGRTFSAPAFQSIPIYIFVPVGTVIFLIWLARHRPKLATALAIAVLVETIAWGLVWFPQTSAHWIRVPPAAAAALDRVANQLPANAEVVASQGIAGRFAGGRDLAGLIGGGGHVRISGPQVWFVIAPAVGIETAPAASEDALIAKLAGPLHARPLVTANGIWSYVYTPPAGQTELQLPNVPESLPAGFFRSVSGFRVIKGPPSEWRMVGRQQVGYLVWGDYWLESAGPAVATAVVSGQGPVSVEVWDATTNTLVARRLTVLTGPKVEVTIPFVVSKPRPEASLFHGFGPFADTPVTPDGDQIEVRVYTPGPATQATAFSVGVSRSN
jgi:hypothetical protein